MYCLLEKMGLLGLIKRTVIDLHCEAMQSVAAASKKQVKLASDDSRLLPGAQTTNGCSLDVVRAARDNWERITSDEMLRVAKELGRPLVAPKAAAPSSGGSEASARDDAQMPPAAEAEGTKPAKATKVLAARFLYDGYEVPISLGRCSPVVANADTYDQERPASFIASYRALQQSPRTGGNSHRRVGYGTISYWGWMDMIHTIALLCTGSIQLQLYSPPFHEYRRLFPELAPGCGQIGLDELFPAQRSAFLAEKNRVGDLVLAHQSVSMARQYSKTGCPVSLRPQVLRHIGFHNQNRTKTSNDPSSQRSDLAPGSIGTRHHAGPEPLRASEDTSGSVDVSH